MRINIIIGILSILIIFVIILLIKKYSKKELFQNPNTPPQQPHYLACCDYQPFYQVDEDSQSRQRADLCSHGEYVNAIPDFHVNRFDGNSLLNAIHFVNPRNPCCLRTCINDFTYTPENTENSPNDQQKIGEFKDFIPLDMLGTSQCDQCINNFKSAVGLMAEPDRCESEFEEENSNDQD